MGWHERLRHWLASDDARDNDDVETLNRLLVRLEQVMAEAREGLARAADARRDADQILARLVTDETHWEKEAREALARGKETEARRCLARQLAAAGETREFALETEVRRREFEKMRLQLDDLEDLVARVRVRRETRHARQRLRDANQRFAHTLQSAAHAANHRDGDRPAGDVIRGWDRFEAILERGLARLAGLGDPMDVAGGGLSAGDPTPEPGRPAVVRSEPAKGAAPATPESDAALEEQLRRMRDELSGRPAGPARAQRRVEEEELDRLIDDLSRP